MSDLLKQLVVLLPAVLLAVGVFVWLSRRDRVHAQNWNVHVSNNGFVFSEMGLFPEEARFLASTRFGTVGPREPLQLGKPMSSTGLEIHPVQLARRQVDGVSQTWFRYESLHGDASVKNYGVALLVLFTPIRDAVKPFAWRVGRSGNVEELGDGAYATQLDLQPLRGHADGGWLVGGEGSPSGVVFWVTAPRISGAQPSLDFCLGLASKFVA